MNININEKDLYQFIIAEMRYAFTRDNHLMPWGAIEHAKKYISLMPGFGIDTARQLKDEIETEMRFKKFSKANEQLLIGFVAWLNDFIIKSQ